MKLPALTLLLLLSGCTAVMAGEVVVSRRTKVNLSDLIQERPASATIAIKCCDTVDGPWPMETDEYVWKEAHGYPISNSQLFEYEQTTETIRDCDDCWPTWIKYRKVPYKIEWHCSDWDMVTLSDKLNGTPSCVREEGYREDGAVCWRKVKP